MSFWVRGEANILWASVWITLFFYWNFCIFYLIRKSKSLKKKVLELLPIEILDLSFILAILYAGFMVFLYSGSVDLVRDSPSIWCTFFVVQAFFVPHLFRNVIKNYKHDIKEPMHHISLNAQIILVALALLTFLLSYFFVPIFSDLMVKFTFG